MPGRDSSLTCGQNRGSIVVMKGSLLLSIALTTIALGLSSCQSASIDAKADEYRRTGAARDMMQARQMAENYYWPVSARSQDYERRSKSEVFARKEDAR